MTKKYSPYKVIDGKEHLVKDQNDKIWAGKWQEEIMDEQDMINIGSYDDPIRGPNEIAGLPYSELCMHLTVTGETGYGKSTAVRNILYQISNNNYGFCYITDSQTDAKSLVNQIPENREDNIVWIEPKSERDRVLGFNIIQRETRAAHKMHDREGEEISNTLMSVISDHINYHSSKSKRILEQFIQEIIECEEEHSLVDIVRVLSTIGDEQNQNVCKKEYDINKNYEHNGSYNRDFESVCKLINTWVDEESVRKLIAPKDQKFSPVREVLNNNILIVNTSSMQSKQVEKLFKRSIISKIWTAVRTEDRTDPPFYICVDPYENIVTENYDLNNILSQGRSFGLGLIPVFSRFSQLTDKSAKGCRQARHHLTFNQGQNTSDTASIAQLHEVGSSRISELEPNKAIFSPTTKEGFKSEIPFDVSIFGERKPTDTSLETIIEQSLNKYGCKE